MTHRVLDLFAGIGGFSLGLERTGGFSTSAFCEIDEKCRKVLRKHWQDVPIYEDVTELSIERLEADGTVPTVITGGFPCQDISLAGKGKGIIGERSGLWSEMFRLIRDVRPAWAIAENVSALRSKGLALVLQNFSEIGYCAEWHCIPASAIGAPHQRDRIWIIARPNPDRGRLTEFGKPHGEPDQKGTPFGDNLGGLCADVADTDQQRLEGWYSPIMQKCASQLFAGQRGTRAGELSNHWQTESGIQRVVDGVPGRVDRLKQIGNAVVPQIPQMIGSAILEAEKEQQHEQ